MKMFTKLSCHSHMAAVNAILISRILRLYGILTGSKALVF
jgi:hypothetical protein